MLNKKLTFILYDGITNSIFVSQVLQPILNLLKEDNNLEITLVSFEKTKPFAQTLKELIPAHDRLHLVISRKAPFYGKSSLKLAIYQLKNLFKIIDSDEVIARGPLAGWVAIQALKEIYKEKNYFNTFRINKKIELKIQARGLCAEEYRFTTQEKKENLLMKKARKFIYNQLIDIEYQVYKKNNKFGFSKTIEAVSPALKEYITTNFNAQKSKIKLATKDIPQNINFKEKNKWRKIIRAELNIKEDQPVYCYSGSYKPWQCIPEIIEYFCQQYEKNSKSFLMLLSPDKKDLEKLLVNKKIPTTNYILISVKAEELFKYMAAGDIGLLFREKDIINWVSRPTKMLEYKAVGLKIMHNQTIAWLNN
ncbi:MAG: hypothetical protein ABIF12_01685 [bacterium]